MECLRKAGEKSKESKNRMPSIAEAGALAVATTVKPHSLTSNNDITPIASFPKECLIEESFYNLPVPKMPPRRVNTIIQHNLNRTLVLMILLATSGLVLWNGEKWIASYKKSGEVKDIVIMWDGKEWKFSHNTTDGDKVYFCNGDEIRLSYIFDQEKELIKSRINLEVEWSDDGAKSVWFDLYDDELIKHPENDVLNNLWLGHSYDNFINFLSILDNNTELLKKCDPYYQPYLFIDILRIIETTLYYNTDNERYTQILSIAGQFIEGFSKLHPEFFKDLDGFQEKYKIYIEARAPPTTLLTHWKENHADQTVSSGGQGSL